MSSLLINQNTNYVNEFICQRKLQKSEIICHLHLPQITALILRTQFVAQ